MKYYGDDGKLYQLGNEIGSGGEALCMKLLAILKRWQKSLKRGS